MKYKLILFLAFFSVSSWLHSTIWEIKQDGTGNFTTIQEGINASVNSDTVLVYPGTYYENIDYLEKSLTVASLYIITPEDSLINQTIIDGNEQFRCVTIDDCLSASLIGFTIQNGAVLLPGVYESYQGGGVFINNTQNGIIAFCKIINNKSYAGGGVYINHGNIELNGNTISNNEAIEIGGGLHILGNNTVVQFDQIELNNLYLNYAATGADINMGGNVQNVTDVIVDTFTVLNPDYFFITCSESLFSFSCLHNKLEEVDHDLFVSPDGDDENNGLTANEPLQTIAWAQTLIKRNDDYPHTIHLAAGTYSPSLNNQIFPLNVKHGVIIKGASADETILDAENESNFFFQLSKYKSEFAKLIVRNLKLVNGEAMFVAFSGGIVLYKADMHLDNVIIENCNGGSGSAINIINGYSIIENVIVKNNSGGKGLIVSVDYNCSNPVLDATLINTYIQNNFPDDIYTGGGLYSQGHMIISGSYNIKMIGCEISGNYNNFYDPQTGLGGTSGAAFNNNLEAEIVNCTIGDNILESNTGCSISVDNNSTVNIYNSILYDNDGYSLIMMQNALANISNSLIEGGDANVRYYYPLATVNWLTGNLDENPMFDSLGIYPFALLNNSPCIDMGTLDLPTGIELSQYDLAGNPRIYGDTVDMGAYEWQGTGVEEPTIPNSSLLTTNLSNYPNPFNPSTTIKLELAEAGKIELAIYNIKGQKVKTLMDCTTIPGTYECNWNGKDESGKSVSSGQYIVKLKQNEKETAKKIMMLK